MNHNFINPPSLSTSFTESSKSAKKRFNNILNTKVKKKGVVTFVIVILLIGIVSTLIACNQRKGVVYQIPTEELYKYKGTLVGNNSKVSAIVNLLDFTGIPVHSISLQTNNKPYSITVNYKVDSRADYRFLDYSSFDKNAAVMFALIPNADEIDFRVYDNYSSVDNPDTSFTSAYYNRQNLSERVGMEYFINENIIHVASSIESFTEYYNKVMAVSNDKFYNKDFEDHPPLTQIYHIIGDDCEIVTNSGMQNFITITKEIVASKELKALLEPKNISLDEYIGKKIEFLTYGIRNFKTNQDTSYLFVFDDEKLIAYEDLKLLQADRMVIDILRTYADEGD